jgi:hypothetical protein
VPVAPAAAAALLATALLGTALAGCSSGSSAAAAGSGTSGRICPSAWLGEELGSGRSVELLVAAGATIPANRWPAYRAMATAVAGCAGPGSSFTLRPVTAESLTELPLFSATVPAPVGQNEVNPLLYRSESRRFAVRAEAAVDRLPAVAKTTGGSDPLGALAAAGQSAGIEAPRAKRVVVVIFNGWQQTRALNLFAYRRDPAASTGEVVRSLRASGALPALPRTDVVIAGLTPGVASMQTSDAQIAGLCRFWRGVVEAAGGTLKLCVAALPGIDS